MRNRTVLVIFVGLQVLCALFFIGEIAISVLGLPIGPLDWTLHELIEVAAALGLVIGSFVGAFAVRQARRRTDAAETALREARSAFRDILEARFTAWDLTPAERDVALFAIKGFSLQDIAGLRGVSEGTVKAQSNAIYRKAGVTGRAQLLSLFIDELVVDVAPQPSSSSTA
ncbi:MAG: helix-turn-helix transcriptional regulator [Pseudomonadota bacterium]